MDLVNVEKALEGLRGALKKDGADLIVKSADEDRIELSLVLGEGACLDCIVGGEILTAKIKIALSKVFPQVPKIELHDPTMGNSV